MADTSLASLWEVTRETLHHKQYNVLPGEGVARLEDLHTQQFIAFQSVLVVGKRQPHNLLVPPTLQHTHPTQGFRVSCYSEGGGELNFLSYSLLPYPENEFQGLFLHDWS